MDSRVGGFFCYALQNVLTFSDQGDIDADAVRALLMRLPDPWHDDNAQRLRDAYFGDPGQRLRFGVALPEAGPYLPQTVLQPLIDRVRALRPELVTGHWDVGRPRTCDR